MAKNGQGTSRQASTGTSIQRAKVNRAVKASILRDEKLVKAPAKLRRSR